MMAGSHGPSGAFTIYRPPWEGFFKPPAMRVVADSSRQLRDTTQFQKPPFLRD
jgi:hypothetical protein